MLKVKPFRENTAYCGPASLKMVLDYYGIEKTEQELAEMTDCTVEFGVEAGRIVEAATELGLQAFVKDDATMDDIREWVKEKQVPVIVDWFSDDDGHYSVVVDIDEENIYVLDPELGYVRAMRLNKFYRVWFDFPGDYIRDKEDVYVRRMIVVWRETAGEQ